MKKIISGIILGMACCIQHAAYAQSLSPKATPTSGGYFSAGGKSLSWTMGETFYKPLQNGNVMLTQGFQQPYVSLKILNLTVFLEGYYVVGGQMPAVLYNSNPTGYPTNACDSITIELHAPITPYSLVASTNVLLHTNGSATAMFPNLTLNGSYYIVFSHRNSITTWSKVPVSFSTSTVNFDLTTP